MSLQDIPKRHCIEAKPGKVIKEERKSIIKCRKEEIRFRRKRYSKEENKEFRKKTILFRTKNMEELARSFILEHETSHHLENNKYLPLLKEKKINSILPITYTFLYDCIIDYLNDILEKAILFAEEWSESHMKIHGVTLRDVHVQWAASLLKDQIRDSKKPQIPMTPSFLIPFHPISSEEIDMDLISEEEITSSCQ
jgi:hypothetical protein